MEARNTPWSSRSIDRSFVAGLADDDANLPIVQAVVALAHGLGIDVTAEGIETVEQLDALRGLACDHGQGFYYARPLPASEFGRLLVPGTPPPRSPMGGPDRRVGRPRASAHVRRAS